MSIPNDLRRLAAFFEDHPEIDAPCLDTVNLFVDSKEEMAEVARKYGPLEKYAKGNSNDPDAWYTLRKNFGSIYLDFNIRRSAICEMVVTGKDIITRPKMVQYGEETVEVEKKEWRCAEPLLAPSADPFLPKH